jgi:hypothetical protein
MTKFIIVVFENQEAETRTELPYEFLDEEVAYEFCQYLNSMFSSFSHIVEPLNG